MMPLELVLDRADNAREAGDGYLVSCPLQDHGRGQGDRNPSVSVALGEVSVDVGDPARGFRHPAGKALPRRLHGIGRGAGRRPHVSNGLTSIQAAGEERGRHQREQQ